MIKLLIQQDNAGHNFLAQAEGWGKSFTANCKGKTNLDKWILFAKSRIVLDKLKGFVENRRIAYNAKGYKEKSKMEAVHSQAAASYNNVAKSQAQEGSSASKDTPFRNFNNFIKKMLYIITNWCHYNTFTIW
jgi:hypothetical protein